MHRVNTAATPKNIFTLRILSSTSSFTGRTHQDDDVGRRVGAGRSRVKHTGVFLPVFSMQLGGTGAFVAVDCMVLHSVHEEIGQSFQAEEDDEGDGGVQPGRFAENKRKSAAGDDRHVHRRDAHQGHATDVADVGNSRQIVFEIVPVGEPVVDDKRPHADGQGDLILSRMPETRFRSEPDQKAEVGQVKDDMGAKEVVGGHA
ncbi:MAG: hypothetical protein NTY53_24300, partial [Kiritimatiellaeota bacterium]|nr:hypothetical protein [Kiritimatiellota bacterium]